MNITVTGGSGALGRALREFLPDARYLNRAECDVRDPARVSFLVRRYAPDVVVHAAAITDHQHPSAADLIETNIGGTHAVARACRTFGARMVYLSTHYVYGGEAPAEGYNELDPLAPIGAYAWSKLAGEHWVEALVPAHTIVRGSWYTPAKVRGWAEHGALVDAWHNRLPVAEAARAIARLVGAPVRGVVNIGARQRETFHDTARRECPGMEVKASTRATLDLLTAGPPYAFPRDTTVSIARWEALRT